MYVYVLDRHVCASFDVIYSHYRRFNQAGQVLKIPLVSSRHARTRAAAQAQFPKFMYNSLVVCNVPFCKTCNYDANRVKYTGQYSVSEFMPFNLKKYWLVEVGVNRLTAGSGVARVDHRLFKN
jgi:hypothetical protein